MLVLAVARTWCKIRAKAVPASLARKPLQVWTPAFTHLDQVGLLCGLAAKGLDHCFVPHMPEGVSRHR